MRSPDFENKRDKTAPSAWPYAAEISSGFWSSETVLESPHYLLLSPQSSRKVQDFFKKHYRKDLTEIGAPFPRFEAMRRYPQLEQMTVEAEGKKMTGAEVAEYNRREITKAGVARWDRAIRELFQSSGLREIRRHKAKGPLVVATVGCEEGYGIREVAQVFSRMQIPIALYAVDPRGLPDIEEYKDFYFQTDFSLFLNSQDPREILWTEVQPDVVIFPRLWMADFFSYDAWKETISQIAEAKPSIIISGFPRVSPVIRDPFVLEDILKMTADLMYKRGQISSPEEIDFSTMGLCISETGVLGGLLYYYGYLKKAIKIYSNDLLVPYNTYGAAINNEGSERLMTLDPYFLLTVHKDLYREEDERYLGGIGGR